LLVNMVVKKRILKFCENGLIWFYSGIVQMTTSKKDNLWNLKLSYLDQIWWIILTEIYEIKNRDPLTIDFFTFFKLS
jgi:hypothetical protein